ncbi:MAG: tetratricopeptide repeat protein [Caldimicrobium sp.]|nr:tetratricopeptide repeat protein [Caldimicrobium sp.]MDW8182547.1 tetratricopeptide repeat protein [Caldimicrobium sp.]
MKYLYLTVLSMVLLSGCLALQDEEISTLRIKVLNLETLSQRQASQIANLDKRLDLMQSKLAKELSDKFLQGQLKLVSDLEEIKKELTQLQSRIDESQMQREAEGKAQRKAWEELNFKIDSLDLKIKKLESLDLKIKKLESQLNEMIKTKDLASNQSQPQPLENKTTTQPLTNATLKEDLPKTPPPTNQTTPTTELPLKEEDLYQRAFNLYEKGNLIEARAHWEEYVKRFPKGKWIGQSHFYLGEIAMKERDYETAILEYQKLVEMKEANPLKPKAMLRQAEAFLALKDKKAAEILYKKIIQTYQGTKEAKEAEKKLREIK